MPCASPRAVLLLLVLSLAAAPSRLDATPSMTTGSQATPPAAPSADAFTLRGRVVDPSGARIAGARVTAIADGGGPQRSAVADDHGEFELPLPPGRYTLRVASDGFRVWTDLVHATPGGSQSREFQLQVADVRESVTVNAAAGYRVTAVGSATKISTPLLDVPQSITVVPKELMNDQLMTSIGDVVRYVPGITAHQGENNRDDVVIRGNRSSADFFLDGVRDDAQYYRDLYNLERVEALKGPNAMIFGRGGGGGVVNRVTKEAGFRTIREGTLQAGGYGRRRFTADVGAPLADAVAVRLNGMYENSDSFREAVELERYGFNPTMTIAIGADTRITASYEYLNDTRVADRGITSFQGRPADVDIATYYGNPDDSHVKANVNLGSVMLEHRAGRAAIRNRTQVGGYDRSYQNYVPGAVNATKTQVALTAYNNAANRLNVFNQTDVTSVVSTGGIRHTLLAGAEIGRQTTDNFRNTGYFNDAATSILVPYSDPRTSTPVTFRQSATDADNHVRTNLAAAYVQDQVALSSRWQAIGGLRFDRFDLRYDNNRNGDTLERVDHLVSPRAGLVYKPIAPLSVYTSYSVSYLPSSGDQFASLTVITEQVEPEKFSNYEVGVKYDLVPDLSLTTAVYRLDRTNTRSLDPNDPTRIVQTGSQRTTGCEVGLNGRISSAWSVAGGYAYQDAHVTSATISAREGAQVAQVPHHTASLWNSYQIHPRLGVALGVLHRSDMFAAIDNTVTLPGYTRADAAVFVTFGKGLRLQANLENLGNTRYYVNADSNTNISPGFPRTLRLALTAIF